MSFLLNLTFLWYSNPGLISKSLWYYYGNYKITVKIFSKDYFKKVVLAKKKELKWKPEVKNWVDGQKFSYVALTDTGFSFKTDFSTIYGEKEIIIPYQELAVNLKNRSIIKELFTK